MSPATAKRQDRQEEKLEAEPHGPNGDTTLVASLVTWQTFLTFCLRVEARWMVQAGYLRQMWRRRPK